jgi:hypothetical protein
MNSHANSSLFTTRPTLVTYVAARADLEARSKSLFDIVKSGKVKIGISARYKLADAAQCHRELEALPAIHCRRESHKLMSCFRSKKCDTNFRNGSET